MKKHLLLLAACLLLVSPAFAQSAANEIETLLNTKAVTYAQAARFVLEASDAAVIADPARAFRYAADRNWIPKHASANETARLDGIALLVMCSFDIKGGILYSFFKNPHFAYRELVYHNIIFGRIDPAMKVSGDDLLYIINRIFSMHEDEEIPRLVNKDEAPAKVNPPLLDNQQAVHLAKEEALAEEINIELQAHRITDAHASVTGEGVMISLSNVQFLPESAMLTETERRRIREIAQILSAVPGRKIQISGHSALAGTEESQVSLSRERAQAVADYMVSIGARRTNEITVMGFGASRPIANNTTEEGMAANRRVEITILDN